MDREVFQVLQEFLAKEALLETGDQPVRADFQECRERRAQRAYQDLRDKADSLVCLAYLDNREEVSRKRK